jgi:Protein of unknown function (DUF3443)
MRSGKILLFLVLVMAASCGGGDNGSSGTSSSPVLSLPNGPSLPQITGYNVLPVSVGGPSQYANEATVTVTICDESNTICQTIDNILLDSGDYGLRIFQQVLNPSLADALALSPVEINTEPLYECIEYGDGSGVWGPVELASVTLSGEQPVLVPIQVIGLASFNSSTVCLPSPPLMTEPKDAGYNGSLGIGFFARDCGDLCTSAGTSWYFTCSVITKTCTSIAVSTSIQVQNPVAALPTDNNGVLVRFPSVPAGGSPSASGYLILGIGTQLNNIPSGVTAYAVDNNPGDPNPPYYGNFTTKFEDATYSAFLDIGSNGLFFASNQIPTITVGGAEWFNPPSLLTLYATNVGYPSGPAGEVEFQVNNFNTLASSSNNVFSDLAGPGPDSWFDWGLPFFLGRNVYIGIEGTTSTLGTGPYWAY